MRRSGEHRSQRRLVHVLAWPLAIPLGLVITAWPANHFRLLTKADLLDLFITNGVARYTRVAVFVATWAFVMTVIVSLIITSMGRVKRWRTPEAASLNSAASRNLSETS